METSEKRPWRSWALEVHEKLVKLSDGGELLVARRVTCKKDAVTLSVENGQATWREADRQIVMLARGRDVHVEVRDAKDAAARTITAAKLTVEWEGGLRLVPAAATAPAARPAEAGP
ncbi:MAG: hypothetical protein AMJ81_01465 [Phycisphaerae bacterium SM23_33]|nr:MAG: hypothetical protein AMJ81_01465 [Phycisphaerae bacterium SM23_33]